MEWQKSSEYGYDLKGGFLMYHWLSTFTGEVVEDFPTVVSEVISTIKYYAKSRVWDFPDVVRYAFCWKYSKAGF